MSVSPHPRRSDPMDLETAIIRPDSLLRVRCRTQIRLCGSDIDTGVLLWCSNGPAAESGEGHMGNVRDMKISQVNHFLKNTNIAIALFFLAISVAAFTGCNSTVRTPTLTLPYVVDSSAPDQGAATSHGNRSLKDHIDAIGSSRYATITLPHTANAHTTTYTLKTSETVPSNVILKFDHGAVISDGSGSASLTINGPENISAEQFQIFSFTGSGSVVFTNPGVVPADWWAAAKNAAAVNGAFAAVAEGSTIELSGGTWSFGRTTADMRGKNVHIRGVGYEQDRYGSPSGTLITYTGTNGAFWFNLFSSIERLTMDGKNTGRYGLILGNTGGSPVHWGGAVRDAYITNFNTAGIRAYGIQMGLIENVFVQGNSGAGMHVDDISDRNDNNTHALFSKVRFHNNGKEGILFNNIATNFSFNECVIESNGYEGIKNQDNLIMGLKINGCYIASNQADPTRTSGYYGILLNHADNEGVVIINNYIDAPQPPWDGRTGNKRIGVRGRITFIANFWRDKALAMPWVQITGNNPDKDIITLQDPELEQNENAVVGFTGIH